MVVQWPIWSFSHTVDATLCITPPIPVAAAQCKHSTQHWYNVRVTPAAAAACLPVDILKFYGCELGAQTNFDKGTGTSIVNGAHDTKVLCEKLEMFIKK
jgi:hypothetical protein